MTLLQLSCEKIPRDKEFEGINDFHKVNGNNSRITF